MVDYTELHTVVAKYNNKNSCSTLFFYLYHCYLRLELMGKCSYLENESALNYDMWMEEEIFLVFIIFINVSMLYLDSLLIKNRH